MSAGPSSEQLYRLLPAAVRRRDAEQGGSLRALVSVLETELVGPLQAEIETLWDNWFIETCEEWLVPYIGEALGVTGLRTLEAAEFSLRGYVANTIARRRRKGTAVATEQLARDVTGYPARAVEMFALTAVTTNVNHVRPPALGTIDVRDASRMETYDGPFDPFAKTPDVRHPDATRARHNFPNLTLFLWRLRNREVSGSTARRFPGETNWFHVDPLGLGSPLFNLPVGEDDIVTLAGPEHVPHPLSRLELSGSSSAADPPVAVRTVAAGVEQQLNIEVCNLSDVGGALPSREPAAGAAAVDPELGRIVLHPDDVPPSAAEPFEVLVDYAYGAPGPLGAGTFDRTASWREQLGGEVVDRQWAVSRRDTVVGDEDVFKTLEEAVSEWNGWVGALAPEARAVAVGLISLTDSRSYEAPTTVISVPDGARLYVVAAAWRESEIDGVPVRRTADIVPNDVRTHIIGNLTVEGTVAAGAPRAGGLWLNGLLVEGAVRVRPGDLELLDGAYCTLTTGIEVAVASGSPNAGLRIRLDHSICGRIASSEGAIAGLDVADSLVQSEGGAIDLAGGAIELLSCTIIGGIRGTMLSASDSILDEGELPPAASLDIAQRQEGCLRFSYVPAGARTPRRYRCQPDIALEGVVDSAARARIVSRVRPVYAGEDLGDPGLAVLSSAGPGELRAASSDGSEPGVWHHLQHAGRLANLGAALRQYLRFGLEAGVLIDL